VKEIQLPLVWKDFASGLHQDFDILYPDLDSYADEFLASINYAQRIELQEFLLHAIGSDLPGGMLKKYFRNSGANFVPRKPKEALTKLLNRIKKGDS
jgi:hypothetical protein